MNIKLYEVVGIQNSAEYLLAAFTNENAALDFAENKNVEVRIKNIPVFSNSEEANEFLNRRKSQKVIGFRELESEKSEKSENPPSFTFPFLLGQ